MAVKIASRTKSNGNLYVAPEYVASEFGESEFGESDKDRVSVIMTTRGRGATPMDFLQTAQKFRQDCVFCEIGRYDPVPTIAGSFCEIVSDRPDASGFRQ